MNINPNYLRMLEEPNCPVDSVFWCTLEGPDKPLYSAVCRWKTPLSDRKEDGRSIFGGAAGSGVSRQPGRACDIAISEAIERWAHLELSQRKPRYEHMLRDPSTTGFAAFPGSGVRQARSHAFQEAAERYVISEWWAGRCQPWEVIESAGSSAALFKINRVKLYVAVAWESITQGEHVAYGSGCSDSRSKALQSAQFELLRHRKSLEAFFSSNPAFGMDDLSSVSSMLERRFLYFALPQGREHFSRMIRSSQCKQLVELPQPIFDSQIEGPWASHAVVWRTLLPNAVEALNYTDDRFFLL